ncbi:DUF863 domain-containing protein [Quillaja saponaria]|uniref:DUF863 domain-containing protein n=1 Tax=Quillaja saponaria TaxID=32244 RepID=A0AAD7VG75_QUISA|nr:DUF863 domain-containing protein [Quillaja saponaria]
MGTKIHSKMYLPGCYSMHGLTNTGNTNWSLQEENTISKNPEYYGILMSTRPHMDGYNTEKMRKTILIHESIFKHQLHELHRLYRRQRDLMYNIRNKEIRKYPIPAGTSQSNLFSSRIQFEDDDGRQNCSNFPMVDSHFARQFNSGLDNIQSYSISVKGNAMQSSCAPNQSGEELNEESLDSKCKKMCRKLFDLELPADEYIDFEAESKGSFKVSREESFHSNRNNESIHERRGKFSTPIGTVSGCDGGSLSSSLYLSKDHGNLDLNEPIDQVGETSAPSSGTCFEKKIHTQILSGKGYSGICYLAKASSRSAENERSQGVFYQPLDNEKNRGLFLQAGETRNDRSSCSGNMCPQDFKVCESAQSEQKKAPIVLPSGREKTERQIKRKLFGVEISARNQDAFSEIVNLQIQCVPKSDVAKSRSSFLPSRREPPRILSQNFIPIQGSPCFTMSPQLNSTTSLRAEVSYINDVCLGSHSHSNELEACHSSISLRSRNGMTEINSHSGQFMQHGPPKELWNSGCMTDAKFSKDLDINALPPNKHQNGVICPNNFISEGEGRNLLERFPWFRARPHCDEKSSEKCQGIYQMDLESSQNYSQQLISKIKSRKKRTEIHDCLSADQPIDTGHKMIEGDRPSNMKIHGFPIYEKAPLMKDPTPNFPLKPTCLDFSNEVDNSVTYGLEKSGLAYEPISTESEVNLKVDGVLGSRSLNHSAESRLQIDLNICVTQEETQLTPDAPIIKVATEMDLEAQILVEKEIDISPGGEFSESIHEELVNSLEDACRTDERLVKFAAQALVAISSSYVNSLQDNVTSHQSEAPIRDSLHWFAELISLHRGDIKNDTVEILAGKDSVVQEEFTPDGVDYFEFMTLNLTETKVEKYFYKPRDLENPKEHNTLPKRPRKGQTRRGRKRNDFQRDILPSLTSLSRNEVNEDLQTIEGLIKACGGSWQSSLANRMSGKGGRGRGRRRSGVSAPSPSLPAFCLPQIKQPNCEEPGLGERSLTGWGKRTRGPPRQRCLINNPSVSPI